MKAILRILVGLAALGCTHETEEAREVARVRAHLEGAERLLLSGASAPRELSAAQTQRRRVVAGNLRHYIESENYPTNRISRDRTPIFIDGDGARCAVAALLEADGRHAMVQRIAQTDNLAYIQQLAGDRELTHWLATNGISVAEAARIQPSYANTVDSTWKPTASLGGSVQAGGATGVGVEAVLATGLRVGARRVTYSNSSCDECVHSSMAFIAEYSRSLVARGGTTNQFGLLLQYDLNDQAREHQLYLIGGPLASVDESDEPGDGWGGQLGVGFSARGRSIPLFAELIVSGLDQARGAAVRGGLNIGAVW